MNMPPSKLIDSHRNGAGCELIVVEGDSAASSVDRLRAKEWQAVLPMQGKPRNAMKSRLEDLQQNPQFNDFITSMGVTWNENGECDIDSLRYERIVLLFDPDADGIHSRTLLLLFFYRWLRPVLDAGRVFDAHAPRWSIQTADSDGPEYAFSDEDLARVRQTLRDAGREEVKLKRFLGLGNADASALSRFCLDSETRQLSVLSAADAESALDVFRMLKDYGTQL